MIPVRCFSCNAVIGQHWKVYKEKKNGLDKKYGEIMDELGIVRICCRRMFLSHCNVVDDILMYSNTNEVMDESGTKFYTYVNDVRTLSCD